MKKRKEAESEYQKRRNAETQKRRAVSMSIFFISLLSRENKPLHIQEVDQLKGTNEIIQDKLHNTTNPPSTAAATGNATVKDIIKYHFLSHMVLDVFLSPFYEGDVNTIQLLFIQDGINVYGYETNTGLKIVIGVDDDIIESRFITLFQRIHKIYLNLILNPFQDDTEVKINKATLSNKIDKVVHQWRNTKQ